MLSRLIRVSALAIRRIGTGANHLDYLTQELVNRSHARDAKMTVTERLQKEGGKPSKAPLYKEALRLFLESPKPDLNAIAHEVGLRADALITAAERQQWSKRKAIMQRDQSQIRAAASALVDDRLVESSTSHVTEYLVECEKLTALVLKLPTEPDEKSTSPQELAYQRGKLAMVKTSAMREVTKVYKDLADLSASLGLLKDGELKDAAGNKLDHAKLTQLNITINEAMREPMRHVGSVLELQPAAGDDDDVI